jgi:hypothetical protein
MSEETKKEDIVENVNVHVVNLASYVKPVINESPMNKWVEYGHDNDYYGWLIERYKNSTTNNSIVNNTSRLITGRGLHALDAHRRPQDYAQMKSLFKPKDLKAVAKNLKMLGTGVFQCVFNKNHTKVRKVTSVKTKLVRPEKCNEDGDIEAYYYSDDWSDTNKYVPKRVPKFGTSKENIEFLVIGEESIDLKYFNEVDYQACLPYCVLEEEIVDYLINDTQNSFSGTKVVNYNNGIPSIEKQEEVAGKTIGKLTGSKGMKVIIAFNENSESKTTVDDIPLNDAPAHYKYLSDECQAKILNNHNVVSSYIVGITPSGQGFSSSADEIKTATSFFYNQSVKPHQDTIIEGIEEILAFNGVALDLYFKDLNLLENLEEMNDKKEDTNLSVHLSNSLEEFGEKEGEDWEIIDTREVDYDNDDALTDQLTEFERSLAPVQTTLSKVKSGLIGLVSSGTARANAKSAQDAEIDGKFFKVRYKYVGSGGGERDFCRTMMSNNKVYRKEDILQMGTQAVNAGFGEKGADTYSIWLYKGGARCHHKWQRITYLSDTRGVDVKNPNAKTVSTNKARSFGYRPTNEAEVSMTPNDMARKGFHPNNNNLPSDVN